MTTQVSRFLLSACILCVLTGCATGPLAPTSRPAGNTITGSIHGGQQPVTGATIMLYTVGTSGDGSASSQLLTQAVTTDAKGTFTITGDYSCSGATQVYLTAAGGNPGFSAANPNLLLMAALGSCSALTANTFISVNELTTVAAAYALAHYATSATSIGSGTADATALASAFTLANEYVNTTTGYAPGTNLPPGYTDPTALLNTLADVLAACVNSGGGAAGNTTTPCGTLFGLTPSSAGTAPSDTFTAVLNLAKNPGLQTAAIFSLLPPDAPFQPALTQPPPDFNVRISATNGSSTLNVFPGLSYAFADEPVNGPAEAGEVSINNTTQHDVTIGSVEFIGPAAGDFSLVQLDCPPGNVLSESTSEGCTIELSAVPSALGERLAYLEIDCSAPDCPYFVKLHLSGTNVQTAPTYLYLSTAGLLGVYSATATGPQGPYGYFGGGGGAEEYGALHYDYVGNFYSFGQVAYTNNTVGPFVISTNDVVKTGTGGPAPVQSFNPVPPSAYLFNGAATSLTGATSSFAADNAGQIYIPVQSSTQIGVAVYPPDSVGATAPSFVLPGYGGKVAVDPSGDLYALDPTGNIVAYQYGILPTSTPGYQATLPSLLGTGPNARVIDLATDGSGDPQTYGFGNVYALIYGINGYEVVEYTFQLNHYFVSKEIYGAGSQLNAPTALAVDGQGDIFVADTSLTTQKKVVLLYNTPVFFPDQGPDAVIDTSYTVGAVATGIAVR